MAPHDAQFYLDRGSEILSTADPDHQWTYRWDLSSAQADFSHAIKLNPNFTTAYTNRAGVEFMRGDFDEAFKDYTSAIGLNPQDPNNYISRAQVETERRNYESALDDFERAIALQPDNRHAYRGRIRIKEIRNDFAGAVMERVRMIEEMEPAFTGSRLTDNGGFGPDPARWRDRLLEQIDHALETDTNFAWGYFYRGVIKSATNDWTDALADYQRSQCFPDPAVRDYAAIHIWLAQAQSGEKERADERLLAYCRNRTAGTPADWQMCIAKFLLNQSNEADFYKAINATDSGREESEFWYYAGMKHLLADDKGQAVACFQKSLTTKTRSCAVFFSAGAELRTLNPAPSPE